MDKTLPIPILFSIKSGIVLSKEMHRDFLLKRKPKDRADFHNAKIKLQLETNIVTAKWQSSAFNSALPLFNRGFFI